MARTDCGTFKDALDKCGDNLPDDNAHELGRYYGCPSDCVGVHRFGIVSKASDSGVQANGTIAAGATANIIAKPQKRCQPKRFYVSETIAEQFVLVAALIGTDNLLATTGEMPLFEWQHGADVADLRRVICEVSEEVSIQIRNVGGEEAFFRMGSTAYLLRG